MNKLTLTASIFTLIVASAAQAQTTTTTTATTQAATTPAVTATCKDGTNWSGSSHRGACSHHGGVQTYNTDSTAAVKNDVTGTANSAGNTISNTANSAGNAISNTYDKAKNSVAGSAGQVWVNTNSHVYHCSGDRDYGHTKAGKYMTESAAKAEGDRAARGKACS